MRSEFPQPLKQGTSGGLAFLLSLTILVAGLLVRVFVWSLGGYVLMIVGLGGAAVFK